MSLNSQTMIPAVRSMKEFDAFLASRYETMILLQSSIAQLPSMVKAVHQKGKKIWLHMDMVDGLKNDEHGTFFVCQSAQPDAIISTKKQVILAAKKKNVQTIQRLFLLDSRALAQGMSLASHLQPDYIELLPGVVPSMIKEVSQKTTIPLIAGGFITRPEEVKQALEAGAVAISTSQWGILAKKK